MSKAKKLYYALQCGEPNEATALLAELTKEELSYTNGAQGYTLLKAALDGIRYGITYDFLEDLVNNRLPSDVFKIKDYEGNSPLMEVLSSPLINYKIARLIFDKNPQAANDINKKGQTALSIAAPRALSSNPSDNIELIKLLLEYTEAENFFKSERKGETPLHKAAMVNNYPVVKTLLELNAFKDIINSPNERNFTPLDLAIVFGCPERGLDTIKLLIFTGAKISSHTLALWDCSKLNSGIELAYLVLDQNESLNNGSVVV